MDWRDESDDDAAEAAIVVVVLGNGRCHYVLYVVG